MNQEDILHQILTKYREVENLQKEINIAVLMNRKAVQKDPTFEDGYTESIESYYLNL